MKAAQSARSELERSVRRRKFMDQLFVLAGMAILFASLLTLASLFLKLVHDGAGRFTWDFLTNFPSRNAGRAGILAAWVGTCLVMLVTVLAAMPIGVMLGSTPTAWRTVTSDVLGNRSASSTPISNRIASTRK